MGVVLQSNFAIGRCFSYSVQRRAKSWPRCDRNNACFAIVVLQSTTENSVSCEIRIAKQRLFCNRKKPLLPFLHWKWLAPCCCSQLSGEVRLSTSVLSLDRPIPCADSCLSREFQDAGRFQMQATALFSSAWRMIRSSNSIYLLSDPPHHWFNKSNPSIVNILWLSISCWFLVVRCSCHSSTGRRGNCAHLMCKLSACVAMESMPESWSAHFRAYSRIHVYVRSDITMFITTPWVRRST